MRTILTVLCAVLAIGMFGAPTNAAERTLQSLEATRNRPLFSPTRRPPPPRISPLASASTRVQPGSASPQVELTGVILGPGERAAILEVANDSHPRAVHLGADIDGWRVTAIAARSIILTRADKSVEIRLPAHNLGTDRGR